MASNVDNYLDFTVDDLHRLTVIKLKELLLAGNESTTGKKSSLVSRAYAYICRVKCKNVDQVSKTDVNTADVNIPKECTFDDLIVLGGDSVWSTDLRNLPEVNFHQLYDYLVVKTQKFGDKIMKGSVYKKERSYNFYKEGHISDMKTLKNNTMTLVKAKVVASMKKIRYNVVVVFNEQADVLYAACECPAGLGPNGEGKCNHTGGLLFCVEDFSRKNLQKAPEAVTCTGKLSSWNVPRDLKVHSAPLPNMKIKKVHIGKQQENIQSESVTLYDPRAPVDRYLDIPALRTLYENLENCMPASGFFLFHEELTDIDNEQVTLGENLPVCDNVEVVSTHYCEKDSGMDIFSDQKLLDIYSVKGISLPDMASSKDIECAVDDYLSKLKIDEMIIEAVEMRTKKQSQSVLWQNLRKFILTASNFGKIIKRKINPDGLIKQLLYSSFSSKATTYGSENEENAILAYEKHMEMSGNAVKVEKMGLQICDKFPGLGASVDGKVFDISTDSYGCLEVKCPISRAGLTLEEAVHKQPFCLKKNDKGEIKLNRSHDYFYQVQGQMFVTGLKWADFVVWLNDKNVYVERILFDETMWNKISLPKLTNFYRQQFIPELLSRRVQKQLLER